MIVVPWFSDEVDFAEDRFNLNRNRNIKNTSKLDYNCGGYAFGTFNWYLPFRDKAHEIPLVFRTQAQAEKYTQHCVDEMLYEFRERRLRTIVGLGCLEADEYAIAFRISYDGDFHYVRRHTNGNWFHKCGADTQIRQMSKEEVFSENWCNGRYNGPLVLFAIQK